MTDEPPAGRRDERHQREPPARRAAKFAEYRLLPPNRRGRALPARVGLAARPTRGASGIDPICEVGPARSTPRRQTAAQVAQSARLPEKSLQKARQACA